MSATSTLAESSCVSNVMTTQSNIVGKQDNQNAAVLSTDEAIMDLMERTGYPIYQENGQRRYGPPPNWQGVIPQRGCEVFIGKIPRDCFEDELVPIFQKVGRIYMFRLMMDFNGANRGYGFCIYTNREDTKRAVQELNNYEIRKGKTLGVCLSVDNCRLFVGGIPKNKTREEILVEMQKVTEGVRDVIAYPSVADKTKNRGFAFVEYDNHKAAAMARRKLIPGRIQLWGQQIAVDWAEPEREVNEDVMSHVKILYVRNLMLPTTEETLRDVFIEAAGGNPDCVERVKKIKDYAFVHFKDRDLADRALSLLNNTDLEGSRIEVTWAKPADKSDASRFNRKQSDLQLSDLAPGQIIIDSTGAAYAAASFFGASPVPGLTSAQTICASSTSPMRNGGRLGRRNAAGSRSASARDRKHPIEKLQQHQINPLAFVEVFEDLCQKNGWGTPSYCTPATDYIDPTTGAGVSLYVGQVTLPNLNLQYQTQRLYTSPEEAKSGAAELVIQSVQYQMQMAAAEATTAYINAASMVAAGGMQAGFPMLTMPVPSLTTAGIPIDFSAAAAANAAYCFDPATALMMNAQLAAANHSAATASALMAAASGPPMFAVPPGTGHESSLFIPVTGSAGVLAATAPVIASAATAVQASKMQ